MKKQKALSMARQLRKLGAKVRKVAWHKNYNSLEWPTEEPFKRNILFQFTRLFAELWPRRLS